MHRLTATDTPMVRYTRTIFPSYADIARYSILHDNDRLFMSKYLTYLPSKEQLKAEIDRQKEIFYMQHPTLSKKDD